MEAASDLAHIGRLKEEEERALYETRGKLQQWQKFEDDYTALQTRLSTLPDKVSHQIMVPFGKLAFMPGQLVHTNEILVLLGDNWFSERSAKQACEIVGRRKKYVKKMMGDLEKQQYLLESRLGFVSDMKDAVEGRGDTVEIREEYDAEKEAEWKEEHLARRKWAALARTPSSQDSRPAQALEPSEVEASKTSPESVSVEPSNKDLLWARLDELERQEEELDEMEMTDEEEIEDAEEGEIQEPESKDTRKEPDDRTQTQAAQPSMPMDERKTSSKHVHWKKEESEPKPSQFTLDLGQGKDEEEEEDEDEESTSSPVILFSHTKAPRKELPPKEDSDDLSPRSPGEIYELYQARSREETEHPAPPVQPKSILKHCGTPDSGSGQVGSVQADCAGPRVQSPHPPVARQKVQPLPAPVSAFTGSVIEHGPLDVQPAAPMPTNPGQGPTSPPQAPTPPPQAPTNPPQAPTAQSQVPKRVSKFKAARQGKR